MKKTVKILHVKESGKNKEFDNNWYNRDLPSFFQMHFDVKDVSNHELTTVVGLEGAARELSGNEEYDLVVIPSNYQSSLLELVDIHHAGIKIILVNERDRSTQNEGNYWIERTLTMLTWTNFDEFQEVMNQRPF